MSDNATRLVPETFNPNVAHIAVWNGPIFQVLNEAGDDWDEPATQEQYRAWQDAQSTGE